MSRTYGVPKPRALTQPSCLTIIGFSVVMIVGFTVFEIGIKWLLGQWMLDWLRQMFVWLVIWFWAWRRMGWSDE